MTANAHPVFIFARAGLKTVASAILADVEPGFQPSGKILVTMNSLVKSERHRSAGGLSGRQDAALYGTPGGPPLLFKQNHPAKLL
jgi:hypothetical protein